MKTAGDGAMGVSFRLMPVSYVNPGSGMVFISILVPLMGRKTPFSKVTVEERDFAYLFT